VSQSDSDSENIDDLNPIQNLGLEQDVPEIARIRKDQIVLATIAIIEEEGLHKVSLSKIEQRAKMHRGQLTYYFPTKEAILLAVFDELLLRMFRRIESVAGPTAQRIREPIWFSIEKMFDMLLSHDRMGREFDSLQYTFLAQIAHRPDYRDRLARLYGEWRQSMGEHWAASSGELTSFAKAANEKTVASLVQALVHGLNVQLLADENAFDRNEMRQLVLGLLNRLRIQSEESVPTETSVEK
jgi:AcrR family transcriptional regulator